MNLGPTSEDERNNSYSSSSNNSIYYDTLITHSLDSQDPHSPIYHSAVPMKGRQTNTQSIQIQEECIVTEAMSPAKRKNVLFHNNNNTNSSPARTALSPVKLSMSMSMKNKKEAGVEKNTVLTVAGAVNVATNSVNSVKESAAAGDSKSRQGNGNDKKGGSPNENAHPNNKKKDARSPKRRNQTNNNNNKTKDTAVADAAAGVSKSMIHMTPTTKSGRKHKNNTTMATTTHIATTPMPKYTSTSDGAVESQAVAADGEVSFRSALEDLERLLAEPSASPSALIGPYTPHTPSTPYHAAVASDSVCDMLKTPPTHYTDSVLDYSPYSSADYDYPATTNTSHNNSEIYSYGAAYAEFSSAVKPTSNPLHTEIHTSLVVEELNALLLHTPSSKECSKVGCFDTIECVEDLHVARVLHRVATLLKKLHRSDESIAYLTAARSVYVALHGDSSEVVSIIDQELALTAHVSN